MQVGLLAKPSLATWWDRLPHGHSKQGRKIRSHSVGNAKERFKRWASQAPLHVTHHLLGQSSLGGDGIHGKAQPQTLFAQQLDCASYDRALILNWRHAGEIQENRVDPASHYSLQTVQRFSVLP